MTGLSFKRAYTIAYQTERASSGTTPRLDRRAVTKQSAISQSECHKSVDGQIVFFIFQIVSIPKPKQKTRPRKHTNVHELSPGAQTPVWAPAISQNCVLHCRQNRYLNKIILPHMVRRKGGCVQPGALPRAMIYRAFSAHRSHNQFLFAHHQSIHGPFYYPQYCVPTGRCG